MQRPSIHIAIPKQRYHYGTFQIVVLGDIDSNDDRQYRYIMAFIQEGESQPTLYITAEKSSRREMEQGSHRLRVITNGFEEIMEISNQLEQEANFIAKALQIGANLLNLSDETPT